MATFYVYPVSIRKGRDGQYLARFPDVPEALTDGATKAEAYLEAKDALAEALMSRMADKEDIPAPSEPRGRLLPVALDPTVALKVALYDAVREQGLTIADLARLLGVDHKEARRLLDRAAEQRDEGLIREVLQRFYLSGAGPDALRAIATLSLTDGRFSDAAHYLLRIVEDFPDEVRSADVARLAFAYAKDGDVAGFTDLLAVRPDLVAIHKPSAPRDLIRRVYFDSLVHDAAALKYLIGLAGIDRVALGSDYPFPLGEVSPGRLIRSIDDLGPADRDRLLGGTALEFLGLEAGRFA